MADIHDTNEPGVIDYATLTVSNISVGLVSATPSLTAGQTVKRAIITCETDEVRWRADGTAPTSSEGHLMAVSDALSFMGTSYQSMLSSIRFIRVTTDAVLKITYFT